MKKTLIFICTLIAGIVAACSSDDPQPVCPGSSDGPCPAGCLETRGRRFDEKRQCFQPPSVLGCFPPRSSATVGYCLVRSDGVVADVFTDFDKESFELCGAVGKVPPDDTPDCPPS